MGPSFSKLPASPFGDRSSFRPHYLTAVRGTEGNIHTGSSVTTMSMLDLVRRHGAFKVSWKAINITDTLNDQRMRVTD